MFLLSLTCNPNLWAIFVDCVKIAENGRFVSGDFPSNEVPCHGWGFLGHAFPDWSALLLGISHHRVPPDREQIYFDRI